MVKNLLHPDGKILAIYFPPGLPERSGSCAFASMKCLVNCLSYLIQNSITKGTFDAFRKYEAKALTEKLWGQIKEQPIKLMEWFCWGDCPPEMTDKVVDIIKGLSEKGVIQCGFTRNKELWRVVLKVPNVRIGITIEDIDDVKEYAKKGLVAHPQYDSGETELFYKVTNNRHHASCGGSFMRETANGISYEADCQTCYKNKRGCFTKFEKK